MRNNGWKWILVLILAAGMLALAIGSATAGYNDVTVCTDGDGAAVYTSSSGSKKAGILYNGYSTEISLNDVNGRYDCILTADYSVWVNKEKAEKKLPDYSDFESHEAWLAAVPCGIWLAEIAEDNTPVYTTPKNRTILARHIKGTLVKVCGEFGDDYYIEGVTAGFVAKNALQKVRDLAYSQVHLSGYTDEELPKVTVYASETEPAFRTSSAIGTTEEPYGITPFTRNWEVEVMRDLGDWVQTTYGDEFIEKRFLDPDGDHSYPTARVKTDGVTDRLIVHNNSLKLVSGVQVHVVTRTDEWALIFLTAPDGKYNTSGRVKVQYLSIDENEKIRDGSIQVRLTKDLKGDSNNHSFGDSERRKGDVLPAGTLLKVIGVYSSGSSDADQEDRYLCETEDGRHIEVWSGGCLEPLSDSGVYAAARQSVRMRTEPSPDAKVLYQVKAKTKVEVLLRGEIWTMVKYKDQVGYMMSRYLSFP